eukprot:gene13619-13745_t
MQLSFQPSAQQTRQQTRQQSGRATPTLPARPADAGKASPVPAQSEQGAAQDDNESMMREDPRFGEILSVAEGLDSENLKKAIRKSRVVFNRGGADEQPADPGVLAKYSRDLTALAAENKLDPVIGRHDEMRRLIDVLCRRTKNSVVLLGEPGVGKTAIVQGLAQRLTEGDVPDGLRGCRLIALELGLLMAGKQTQAVKAVLFIDDIHAITGPNAQQGGGVMDASVLLKPLLA